MGSRPLPVGLVSKNAGVDARLSVRFGARAAGLSEASDR